MLLCGRSSGAGWRGGLRRRDLGRRGDRRSSAGLGGGLRRRDLDRLGDRRRFHGRRRRWLDLWSDDDLVGARRRAIRDLRLVEGLELLEDLHHPVSLLARFSGWLAPDEQDVGHALAIVEVGEAALEGSPLLVLLLFHDVAQASGVARTIHQLVTDPELLQSGFLGLRWRDRQEGDSGDEKESWDS